MSACQIDTSLIAFGVGDANIRLWHLSEPDTNKLELQVLWDCIKGKVRAVSVIKTFFFNSNSHFIYLQKIILPVILASSERKFTSIWNR